VTTTTAGTGYTGAVTWASSGGALGGNFASATTYTATITLTASAGYTLTGVTANFFSITGATSVSHSADSGVITAVFPATAKAAQTISFTFFPADITYGTSPAGFGAISSSGLTVLFTSATSDVCTVSGTTVTIVSAGACTINANQAGDANYQAASQVSQSFTIAKASQSITFTTPSAMTVGGSNQTVAPAASSSLTVTLTSTTTGICTVAGFVITAVSAGTCSITANQAGNTSYEAAANVTRTFAVSGPATAAALAITTEPEGAPSGSVLGTQPVIRIIDAGGNTVTTSTANVVVSIASGTGTLSGTTTVAAVSGVATFTNLVITGTAGFYTLTFGADGLTAVTATLIVIEGPAAKVVINRDSAGTQRRTAFTTQPQITIQDAANNRVTQSEVVVTATVSAGGTLVGTTTATAFAGIATFVGLGVDGNIGTTYTITYTAEGLTVATATVTLTGTTCDGITFTCQVGDIGPGGGTVFYVASGTFTQVGATGSMCSTNCKYLEAAPNTWSGVADPSLSWATNINSNQSTAVTGADGTEIGTGYKNSLDIVAQTGNVSATSAAVAARGYAGGSKNDWFLPSKDELNELYSRSATVGGFVANFYWSSSEFAFASAVAQNIGSGAQANSTKSFARPVRPIRAFGVPITISVAAISGVTPPVTGATPVTTTTAGTGYSGTVSWSGSPSTFAASSVYTATITLTSTAGYTLTGVTANFFTVSGASSVTHSANSGVITAVFYMVNSTGPGGGKIFYVASTPFACGPTRAVTCTYLEAAPSGWRNGGTPANDPRITWATNVNSNQTTAVTGADQTAIGSGYQNSIDIVNQAGNVDATSAAVAARNYTGGSKTDWYLPSRDELLQMCKWARGQAWESDATKCSNGGVINSAAGFVDDTPYWSSSEFSSSEAWAQYLIGDSQQELRKASGLHVRPVRSF
jgi:hypothetical protein